MAADRITDRKPRDWYSVPVAVVQRLATFVGFLVLIGFAFFVYRWWDINTQESRAQQTIDEASARIAVIEDRGEIRAQTTESEQLRSAKEARDEAQAAFEGGDFQRSLDVGDRCLAILDALEDPDRGSIRVVSVQGGVEFRRGQRGAWTRLRSHDRLDFGDWVKTVDGGTAELIFDDGSLFTLRQNTMIHLGSAGSGDESKLQFGDVELNTSDEDRTLTTSTNTRAKVQRDSEALVSVARDGSRSRFAAYSGGLEVRSEDGDTREIGALQQVVQVGKRLSDVRGVPGKPMLSRPGDDETIDFDSDDEIVLGWEPVKNARSYALRISNHRSFATSLINDNRRAKTSARLGVRGEGQFYWQVRARDANGAEGPWSHPRSFRVASLSGGGLSDDTTPPHLEVLNHEVLGNIVIVNGKTETGSRVTVNGEDVTLKTDGSFQSTIEMTELGLNTIVITSTDAWKNTATLGIQVNIQE